MLQRTSIEHTVATSNTQRPHRTHSGSMKHMMASCIGHIAVALDAHTSVGGEGLAEIRPMGVRFQGLAFLPTLLGNHPK